MKRVFRGNCRDSKLLVFEQTCKKLNIIQMVPMPADLKIISSRGMAKLIISDCYAMVAWDSSLIFSSSDKKS